ncbi:MAG: hypothetical protein RDU24_05480 [Humidesulfovibrio sp.]|uniref:hypothetical protein n=1 Tax=Humidesulfovibrio sp. TaxID=2910988 RepID=UPI0027F4CCC1|nr:hypothetical protein [Humidesulfovibrio sp.]MDQ7834812.1 hypothetical protein [Humidesulfovibrio sp.]
MDYWPSPLIWSALVSALAIPLGLLLLSLAGRIANCGTRYLVAVAVACTLFAIGAGWSWQISPFPETYFLDLVPALCILATAIMLFETFWSLLAFGFTMNILLCLHGRPEGLVLGELKALLGAGQGVDAVMANRLLMLKKAALVRETPAGLVLFGAQGRLMALVGRLMYAVFNIQAGVKS